MVLNTTHLEELIRLPSDLDNWPWKYATEPSSCLVQDIKNTDTIVISQQRLEATLPENDPRHWSPSAN